MYFLISIVKMTFKHILKIIQQEIISIKNTKIFYAFSDKKHNMNII